MSSVSVRVIDTFGRSLKSTHVEIVNESGSTLATPPSGAAWRLPYGVYTFRGRASLSHSIEREVDIREPERIVVLALPFLSTATSSSLFSSLTAKLVNFEGVGRPDMVRLISVYGEFSAEASILPNGSIYVGSLPPGEYLAIALKEMRLLGITKFTNSIQGQNVNLEFPISTSGR